KGDAGAEEEAAGARGAEGVLAGAEGGPLHQRARFPRGYTGLEEEPAEGEARELHEADRAQGPGEAPRGEQEAGDEREDDAAGRAPAGADADGQGAAGGEVGGEDGEGGTEEEAAREAAADALGEEELGVGGREG